MNFNYLINFFLCHLILFVMIPVAFAQTNSTPPLPPKFTFPKSGLELERRSQAGSFFDVAGRRAVGLGYEHRGMEAWVYPLKVVDDFKLAFKIEGYPLEFSGADLLTRINVRPESTTLTYSHSAFRVRETIFAPIDEAGLIILLDVESVLPIQIIGAFRPKLSLMWPAGLMTGNVDYNKNEKSYYLVEESNRFVGVVGSPVLRDLSVMPYQEEPREVPAQFVIELSNEILRKSLIPIVITGSVEGRANARETYQKLINNIRPLYEQTVEHYRRLNEDTLMVTTPDDRLNTAFAWAKVGIDKGLATNPLLGTGLIAGFRTSGNSERPGFAWFFGRDALWTSFAINSYGDFATTRAALEFLKKAQRDDGKIPHEISQSASLIPWFTNYVYPWASADATPLYIIAHADYLRASGDLIFIRNHWDSLVKAYRFSMATDTDGNGLIENTKVGHGWVEGGRLYPAHEEIYQQGLWIEALRSLAMMAESLGNDLQLAEEARGQAERAQRAVERIYWIEAKNIYAFATNLPRTEPSDDERNEKNPDIKTRMKELRESTLIDETTVLPAVPMWWRLLDEKSAQQMLDKIGGAEISSDWGARILSDQSLIYDPLSYHYGSVWPLFSGWASMAAYRYQRAHIGYDYLMANALLTYDNALGYVTELLSGDLNQAFGRSSHHQVWSCAMVVTPLVRGLLGLEAISKPTNILLAPQLPGGWNRASVKNFRAGPAQWSFDIEHQRLRGGSTAVMKILASRLPIVETEPYITEFQFAPSFPLDSRIIRVKIKASTAKDRPSRDAEFTIIRTAHDLSCFFKAKINEKAAIEIEYVPGTEIIPEREAARVGDSSQFLKLLGSYVFGNKFNIVVEGRSEHSYRLRVRSHRPILKALNAVIESREGGENRLQIKLPPSEQGGYMRHTIQLELGQVRER